jgi:hypothetical protein
MEPRAAPNQQRYVSDELFHFVGKDKKEDEQYELLIKILKSGWLTYPPHDPNRPRSLSLDLSKPISEDRAFKYEVVCFCDIPEADLGIHVRKYSRFGLGFKKTFLIERGACPVFYVANDGPVPVRELFTPINFIERINAATKRGVVDRGLFFDTSVRALLDSYAALDSMSGEQPSRFLKSSDDSAAKFKERFCSLFNLTQEQLAATEAALRGNDKAAKTLWMLADFLLNHVFSFTKPFDAHRSVDDEANYYMEREWRIGDHVNFKLEDVARVFLPANYARRFRGDLPGYFGQISFLE